MTVVEHHSAEELQELFRQEKDAGVAKRIWIAWQARQGRTEPEITTAIGLARRTVQTWVQRYNEEGLAGLRDRAGRGRKPILSESEQQVIAERLEEGPREGDVCSLRGIDFQKFIEDQFGKLMSLSAVYDMLHELGYEWLVPRPKHRKSDPDALAAFQKKSPKNSREFQPSIPTNKSSRFSRMNADSVSKEHGLACGPNAARGRQRCDKPNTTTSGSLGLRAHRPVKPRPFFRQFSTRQSSTNSSISSHVRWLSTFTPQ